MTQWLLKRFGWPTDSETLVLERIRFREILRLPTRTVTVFRHLLEQEAAASLGYGWDFATSVRAIVRSYLNDGYPDINRIAVTVGYSARTLQRRLARHGSGYRALLEGARRRRSAASRHPAGSAPAGPAPA